MTGPQQQAEEYNTAKDFWQQSLKWYLEGEPRNIEAITNRDAKLQDIQEIEKKIDNWYAKSDEALGSLGETPSNTDTFKEYNFAEAKKKRWDALSEAISTAHDLYNKIQFDVKRPPLFPIVSDYGEKKIKDGQDAMTKFGFVFSDVLRPIALEFNFISREAEIEYLSSQNICNDLSQDENTGPYQKAITKIAGENQAMKTKFKEMINNANIDCAKNPQTGRTSVAIYLEQMNNFRFERIKTLLLYMEEQGWAEGSGLGTLDHEMNKAGSGFMYSMYLLRKALKSREPDLFNRLLGAMKWYNDFNEIYQDDSNYIYDGTTADRMRTILLYRLLIILIDNTNKDSQISNLQYFQTWFKHALKINKALGGVIKPDFTGFHHKTYYGSAYVPHGLHNAALVDYFLQGTSFQLDAEAENNLAKALELLRAVAVKYSTPNSLCGRFPNYSKAVLLEHFPAYAYMGYSKHRFVKLFLRLLGTNDHKVRTYLEDGYFQSGIYYWNTIGSLDVLKGVEALKCSNNEPCTAENSPTGHWSKNFAALSIHRRGDWNVAAKGMSRYSWDYESSGVENVFGVFGSHGSLQISNSEDELVVYDVNSGWDWSRVPGATTIKLAVDHIQTSRARNYNYDGKFAGGVAFIGSAGGKPKNGAFGMHFINPRYKMGKDLKTTPLDKVKFEFKKSYFFYNNLIVCLGSDIKLNGRFLTGANYAQTTLFQDKMLDTTKTIQVDGNTHSYIATVNQEMTFQRADKQMVTLKDINNNIYQVETGSNTVLVNIGEQTSKSQNGCDDTKGNYAVAVLKHTDQSSSYKYAILIAGGNEDMLSKYTVMKQDDEAHVIKLTNLPGLNQQTVVNGYSVFKTFNDAALDGPIKSVSDSCMIMTEESGNLLYLAISDPTLEFKEDPSMSGKASCTLKERGEEDNDPNRILNPKGSHEVGARLMYCYEGKASDPAISITLNQRVREIRSVKVDGEAVVENLYPEIDNTKTVLVFANLVNGFTTEVQLDLA